MIDHTGRLNGLVKAELHKLTLDKEPVGYGVGYSFGMVPVDDSGQVYSGPLWMVMLTMRSPLLGHDDIARSLPLFGVLPGDDIFRQVVNRLLTECRKEYDDSMRAATDARI